MQFPWHRIEVSCGLRRPKKSTHTQRSKEGDTIRMARRENGSSGRVQVVSLRVPFSLAVCMPRKMREKGTLRSLSPLSIFLLPFRFAVPRAHQFLPCPPSFVSVPISVVCPYTYKHPFCGPILPLLLLADTTGESRDEKKKEKRGKPSLHQRLLRYSKTGHIYFTFP